jgi:catechol 2,3-dioxygenase-like lactoylglutathione lyase family enzyme
MITAVHTLIYSDGAPATRAFLRDMLGFPFVEDAPSSPGWLIFGTGPSEMGVHPTGGEREGRTDERPRHHQISFMCDDVEATRAELEAAGASFASPVEDHGFGLVTMLELPGAVPIMVYEPRHETAYDR